MAQVKRKGAFMGVIKSLGLVFGDIGTSPIYTLAVVFLLTKATPENVAGVLSLVVWTLIILVSIEYAWLAMSLGEKGEGGTIVLREILIGLVGKARSAALVTFLAIIGVSLLIGDGVITPAISILSAVEGLLLIPGLGGTPQDVLILIASAIAVLLFFFQRRGTERVSRAFGPIMLVWFGTLALSGAASVIKAPVVLHFINPLYGIRFMAHNGIAGFFILSEVVLCATGGEALYADMGHLGREPIRKAWHLVFIALVLSYLGQGSFILRNPGARNVLFEMLYRQAPHLYIPFLLLSVAATVIASQAMISGMFSIVYQGITTRIMPMFRIEYTSAELRSQIYIGFVNWFLMVAVLFIMMEFRQSSRLAAAYGLAVTGTMTLTGLMMSWIFYLRRKFSLLPVSLLVTLVDLIFLFSNLFKIPHGGYWSLIVASVPFSIIIIYMQGQRRLYNRLRYVPLETFLADYREKIPLAHRIRGTALFFARDPAEMPPYIVNTMLANEIIYEDNVIVTITKRDQPLGVTVDFSLSPAPGLRVLKVATGYMEIIDLEKILRGVGIDEKVIFYGLEEIVTSSVPWRMFAAIKKLTPAFVQFYKLPSNKLHGVVTRVEM